MKNKKNSTIKVIKDGPYIVIGDVELKEEIITSNNNDYKMKLGRTFAKGEKYTLCRCGHSNNMPYCDGAHKETNFNGTETASNKPFLENARYYDGPDLTLADVRDLCAVARFCHTVEGDAWDLVLESDNPLCREYAIKAATECPAGRLVIFDKKTGEVIEPDFEPSISILQDPEKGVSGPIWVKGGIPIEGSDGTEYEVRNRVTLCRCGESKNKPFCDARHILTNFTNE